MTNYYIEKENKIVLFDTNKQKLLTTLVFMPQYKGFEIQQTDKQIIERDGGFVFVEDVTDELLQEAKEMKLAQNKEAYEAALKSGVTYKGSLFDCDTLAAVRVMGQMAAMQAMAIEEEPAIDWFNYNYQPVTLTIPEFMELAGLITLNTRRIETLNCGFNTAIEAAATFEELDAITVDYTENKEESEESNE